MVSQSFILHHPDYWWGYLYFSILIIILIGRTDVEAEAPVFWSPNVNSWPTGKIPAAGKDWGQKRVSEDEMAGWYHQCNGHKPGQNSGDGEGQGGLARCSPWGRKDLDTAGQLNNSKTILTIVAPWYLVGNVTTPLFNFVYKFLGAIFKVHVKTCWNFY